MSRENQQHVLTYEHPHLTTMLLVFFSCERTPSDQDHSLWAATFPCLGGRKFGLGELFVSQSRRRVWRCGLSYEIINWEIPNLNLVRDTLTSSLTKSSCFDVSTYKIRTMALALRSCTNFLKVFENEMWCRYQSPFFSVCTRKCPEIYKKI